MLSFGFLILYISIDREDNQSEISNTSNSFMPRPYFIYYLTVHGYINSLFAVILLLLFVMELENIVANTVYLKAREG